MAIVRYAGNRMTGLSSDTKPTEGSLITGTTFHETNTDDLYIWDGDSWNIVAGNTIAETLSNKTLTSPVLNTGLSGTAFLDEDNFASDAADKVASQQSIKAYVASQVPGSQNVFNTIAVSGQDNVVADAATDTLTLAAGSGMTITTTAGSDTVTFASSGTTTFAGLTDTDMSSPASGHVLIYDGSNSWDNKAVSGDITIASTGAVTIAANAVEGTMLNANVVDDSSIELTSNTLTIKSTGVTNAMLAGSIANDKLAGSIANGKLANSSITVSDGSNTTAVALGGTVTFAATANETTVVENSGTVTIGLPNDVVIAGDLTVNGTTTTVSTTNMVVEDNLIELNNGAGSNANDSGIVIERGSTGDNAIFVWDESADKFIVGTTTATGASTGNLTITTGTLVANIEGNVTGNVTGNTSGTSGSTTGNAATATQLATARDIGGVSFNGTADINLPGVNATGNQNTSGTAANVTGTVITSTGGTGLTSYTAGDVLYYSTGTTLTKLAKGTAGQVLTMNSGATAPEWATTSSSGATEAFAIAMAVAL